MESGEIFAQVDVSLTVDDYARFIAVLRRQGRRRPLGLGQFVAAMAWVCMLVPLFVLMAQNARDSLIVVYGVFISAAAVLYPIAERLIRRAGRHETLAALQKTSGAGTFYFCEHGIRVENGPFTGWFAWELFTDVTEANQLVLFFIARHSALIVPVHSVKMDVSEFLTAVRARLRLQRAFPITMPTPGDDNPPVADQSPKGSAQAK